MWQLVQKRGLATTAFKSFLEERLARFPTKAALRVTHQNIRWNLALLNEHSGAVGSGLLDLGLKPKDSVAVALRCNAEHVTLQLGAASAGLQLAAVASMDALTKEGLLKMLRENKCAVLVIAPESVQLVYEALPSLKALPLHSSRPLDLPEAPALRFVYQTGNSGVRGMHRFRDLPVYNPSPDRLSALPELKPAEQPFLVTVDGKTGSAQGAAQTIKGWMDAGTQRAQELKLSPESRTLFKANKNLPSNMALAAMATLAHTAELVVPGLDYDEVMIKKAMQEDNCDVEFK